MRTHVAYPLLRTDWGAGAMRAGPIVSHGDRIGNIIINLKRGGVFPM